MVLQYICNRNVIWRRRKKMWCMFVYPLTEGWVKTENRSITKHWNSKTLNHPKEICYTYTLFYPWIRDFWVKRKTFGYLALDDQRLPGVKMYFHENSYLCVCVWTPVCVLAGFLWNLHSRDGAEGHRSGSVLLLPDRLEYLRQHHRVPQPHGARPVGRRRPQRAALLQTGKLPPETQVTAANGNEATKSKCLFSMKTFLIPDILNKFKLQTSKLSQHFM